MDVVGSEIGQKMRSAIKAKLTELGCYVDDELPDYVMVMVANKRTRSQMEDDLQLFLGDNTELFVNWLHQVLKKLQEVTVSAPLKGDLEKNKKENKLKEKKEKSKKADTAKKSKKKEKEKEKARKKQEKKSHKSKKKAKDHEMIHPNIPPLLMNMEKEPEPSITDVFAGQILKNHGVLLESYKDDSTKIDMKPEIKDLKRPIVPIIDPSTIPSQSDLTNENNEKQDKDADLEKDVQVKEINQIEEKIQGLKQKLAIQLDSMSDDEDFLNIRTEAEELMNDFAEDVLQEISQPPPATPPIQQVPIEASTIELPKSKVAPIEPEALPQIELNLPKRPVRERLGAREVLKMPENEKQPPKHIESPERLTPERVPAFRPQVKSAKSRLGSHTETQKRTSAPEDSAERPDVPKKLSSKVSSLEARARSTCASVVRVRPRPRAGAPASSLLMRAVADAHKSLLNIPPKIDTDHHSVKRALVLPMRRCVDAQKIVIQVPGDPQVDSRGENRGDSRAESRGDSISLGDPDSGSDMSFKLASDVAEKEEFAPRSITKVITNTEYVLTRTCEKDGNNIETINIHNTTVDKSKDTQFIVTMDGYHPNAFLAKKLRTEGILDEDDKDKAKDKKGTNKQEVRPANQKVKEDEPKFVQTKEKETKHAKPTNSSPEVINDKSEVSKKDTEIISPQKRLSDTSEDSATQVIIKQDKFAEKRKNVEVIKHIEERVEEKPDAPPVKKRRASPIVFDVDKKEKEERVRERTVSASSDSHVILTTPNANKYDTLPPLSQAERKPWCRAFPMCRFGAACAFAHPRCKFGSGCVRRGCPYSHAPAPAPAVAAAPAPAPAAAAAAAALAPTSAPLLASHVVPAANYKSISSASPTLCRFYPACVNPACHYHHPKPCRYGRSCANKLECNFYHNDITKWKYSI